MTQLDSLFTPIKIGTMEIQNRLAMSPMTVDYGEPDETPSDRQIAYYVERAKGGVGLIGLEVCSVDSNHRYQQHSLGLHSDEQISGHKKLVDAIHAHGVKVQPQISHPGPESLAPFFKGIQPMGASVIRTETTKQACREISTDEIESIVELYGDATLRAREAGYDGVELHAAHSYMMLGSFLSPLRNFRSDDYAGHSFEGRTKLLFQVLDNIRQKVGEDFPISIRLSGFERESGGREVNDSQRLAPMLVAAGVDCFHVSGGVGDANITQIITGPEYPPGYNLAAAAALKQVVDVPVMVVGQNMDPAFAASIIEDEKADIIAMARALLADPELPQKARSGRTREINRCILCQDCVDSMTSGGSGTACAVNPRCGREREFPLEPAKVSKRVVVVGGGPGGMAAAQAAVQRGHEVTLFEKQPELGGAFRRASAAFPYNRYFLDYLIHQMEALPVDLRLGEEASDAALRALAPDAIIVASGGKIEPPEISGIDGEHVIHGAAVHALVDEIQSRVAASPALSAQENSEDKTRKGFDGDSNSVGQRVVIIGGSLIGMELAEYLALTGRQVRLLEASRRLAMPAGKKRRGDHAKRLDALGVPINTGVSILGITLEGVLISLQSGAERELRADTVIVVSEITAAPSLLEACQELAPEVYGIGDCTGFGLSKKAVTEAMETAYKL